METVIIVNVIMYLTLVIAITIQGRVIQKRFYRVAEFIGYDMVRLDSIEKHLLSKDPDAKIGLQQQVKTEAS